MVTLKDIAKMAGVSTATVSRIINGKGEAKPETIDRVLKLVKELNYQPNRMAQTLSQKKSDLIAIMVPNLSNPFFGELVSAIETEATKNGLEILLCDTNDSREKVEYFLKAIADQYALGAVICTLQVTENDLSFLADRGVRPVTVDRSYFSHTYSAINVDQMNGAFVATSHLIATGAKHITFISGPDDSLSAERIKGYQLALDINQLDDGHIVFGDYTLDSGYQLTQELLTKPREMDGIFAANDLMALGAIRAIKDMGYRVPEDIKVVGNDDLMIDRFIDPRLTSLSQENKQVSQLVIEELTKAKKPGKHIIHPQLMIRESTEQRRI
ncbi:LacI family DNA-binding transcriptional regulator [Dolosicoccus paucivorans]|uniref:LacI family transcriptional regulator n=1 Tax=Dolosicoccus paucivorans TaxID=84521 RepID=A0A2N6SPJ3_9LACT|nr:LacI family DNA-binding transcriptional regulator [Dolosicoccus paucivorans]PMB85049.1 LacI family transcriptional regulator [Dolosicoccus paucivorans]PMC58995.1 LacI family transcriptional regulator [Dolosicoccus paucivorans]